VPTQCLHALQTVVQVLDKQGVLATLKVGSVHTAKSTCKVAELPSDNSVWNRQAQLRACVFAVVDGEEVLATLKVGSVHTAKSTRKVAEIPSDSSTYEYVRVASTGTTASMRFCCGRWRRRQKLWNRCSCFSAAPSRTVSCAIKSVANFTGCYGCRS
jgi:hypothetical protein